jgi:PmbA protein
VNDQLTHSESELRDLATFAVERARALGADASATARNEYSGRVVVREGEVDKAERDVRQMLAVTVYRDARQGSASTMALDRGAIERVVEEAVLIAKHVQPDPDDTLPPTDWLALTGPAPELYAPAERDAESLLNAALLIDRIGQDAARACGEQVRVNEAAANAGEGVWALATSAGFCRSSRFSTNSRWCMMMARDGELRVSEFADTRDRRIEALETPEALVQRALTRTLRSRGARSIASRRGAVIFDPRTASSLIGEWASALNGMAQFRRDTFLADPLGRLLAAEHLDLAEDPFEPYGLASGGFDSEGIAGEKRFIIERGMGRALFLSTVSARKLGLKSTGNAEGTYNLRLTSRRPGGDLPALLARLHTGLLVTSLQGGATDRATGNWTRAAEGVWIEGGEIIHPVRDVTLAGSIPAMLKQVVAVGDDVERFGAIRTGSLLIEEMQVGGSA